MRSMLVGIASLVLTVLLLMPVTAGESPLRLTSTQLLPSQKPTQRAEDVPAPKPQQIDAYGQRHHCRPYHAYHHGHSHVYHPHHRSYFSHHCRVGCAGIDVGCRGFGFYIGHFGVRVGW